MNNLAPELDSFSKWQMRLRTIGLLVLVLGLGSAAVVYWTGRPPEDWSADPSTARAYKKDLYEAEVNFGKMGVLMSNLLEDLKYPGTQAGIIVFVTGLAASGCFYFAQLREPLNAQKQT